MTVGVVIAAAGLGSRFSGSSPGTFPKQFLFLESIIERFSSFSVVEKVVCVVPRQYLNLSSSGDKILFVSGGESRQKSVFNGLKVLKKYNLAHVLIHDAARAFCSKDVVNRVIEKLLQGAQAVIPVVSPVDSVRVYGEPTDRNFVSLVQTPQGFVFDLICNLHQKYEKTNVSDDASLCDLEGVAVSFVDGEISNKKITYKSDLHCCDYKTGFGFDSHEFSVIKTKKLKLCGIEIPGVSGLEGISDADVAVHSVIDAVLGALGKGSIGDYFPETSESSQDADSMELLRITTRMMLKASYIVNNIDITIVCDRPRVSTYSREMVKNIANCLVTDVSSVNVKGKTTEGTRIDGIAAFTNVLLKRLS